MTDIIVIAVVALILGIAILYIVKEKKRGVRCIGCPNAGVCANKNGKSSECGCHSDE